MTENGRIEWLPKQISFALDKVRESLETFKELAPPVASLDRIYYSEENIDWATSFWPGTLFLVKELASSAGFDEVIAAQMASSQHRLDEQIELEAHDIGFLYILTAIADYQVNGHEASKEMALQAADLLVKRHSPEAKIIQAWGNLDDPEQRGRMIIDCLTNLPLLYFAARMIGKQGYYEAAYNHAKQAQKYIARENHTTFHTYYFDTETDKAPYGKIQQGYSDDSCWTRGQAWGICSFTLGYLYTEGSSFLEAAKSVADYFIQGLPEDEICHWDLIFDEGSEEEHDSSPAAVTACGLLELSRQLPLNNEKHGYYEKIALELLQVLAEKYTAVL